MIALLQRNNVRKLTKPTSASKAHCDKKQQHNNSTLPRLLSNEPIVPLTTTDSQATEQTGTRRIPTPVARTLHQAKNGPNTRTSTRHITLIGPNKNEFKGHINDDNITATVTLVHPSGRTEGMESRYIGHYQAGRFSGTGELTIGGGGQYTGEFCNGEFEGKGKRTYPNGSVYNGEYTKGLKNGFGKLKHPTGGNGEYTGQFKNDCMSGLGILQFEDGDRYTGEFENDNFNGHGTYYYHTSGSVYTGDFRRGRRHGDGVMKYRQENNFTDFVFCGQWRDDMRRGTGLMNYRNKSYFFGQYMDDHKKIGYTFRTNPQEPLAVDITPLKRKRDT